MVRWVLASVVLVLSAMFAPPALAEATNLLPNPSFEVGQSAPAGWLISGGVGRWEQEGHTGARSISVTRKDAEYVYWSPTGAVGLQQGKFYHASFWTKRSSGSGRTVIFGPEVVNRDFAATPDWEFHDFYFRTPDQFRGVPFRAGSWQSDGTIWFDDVSLTPAFAVYTQPEELGVPLGDGESVTGGRYEAALNLAGIGANEQRCLERLTARFNTNRWVFEANDEVIYRHQVGRLAQVGAAVEVAVNYCQAGKLAIEASTDGIMWTKLGEMEAVGRAEFPIPVKSAREIWVRLRAVGPSDLQVDSYRFHSTLTGAQSVTHAVGATRRFGVLQTTRGFTVTVPEAEFGPTGGNRIVLKVESETRRPVEAFFTLEQGGRAVAEAQASDIVAPGRTVMLNLSAAAPGSGESVLRLRCRDADSHLLLWEGEGRAQVPILCDASGGELLSQSGPLSVWWCEPERKVSRGRPAPSAKGEAMRISAAGNEYEPAQLVLSATREVKRCRVSVGDLIGPGDARISASDLTVRQVEYVFTGTPTDELGVVDEWPDPLPPHKTPVDLQPGRNQPFWITVHVPAGTPAGDYRGTIAVGGEGASQEVPLVVHVWGFDLPKETHLRSGFGIGEWNLRRYHHLETDAEVRQVFELYLRDFAAHRVCPYDFGRGIGVTWEKDAAGEAIPELDFAGFDEDAHHALDEIAFNSFVLHLDGMGGGTYAERHSGEIAGYKQGTPEYERAFTRYVRAVQDHLEGKGWLRKAYIYWFDEPDEKDTEFVGEGMDLLHRAGPKLTRMLTTFPRPALYGKVDLWCLPTFTLDAEIVKQRQAAGEEMWWYLCTAPKAPFFTLFLDHYGTEIRLWGWETWKYGLDGLLVWATDYWTSGSAYPRPALQNPWQDPMSWVSDSDTPGAKQPWGNGDGRFFYPPTRDPMNDKTKYLEGPTPSIRWELLRDGIEDYEYLRLLKAEIERTGAQQYAPLLDVPADVCKSITEFATSPEPIHAQREKVAQAVEELGRR